MTGYILLLMLGIPLNEICLLCDTKEVNGRAMPPAPQRPAN